MIVEFDHLKRPGVSIHSDSSLVLRHGEPAIERFLKSLNIKVSDPCDSILKFGKALHFVFREMPEHLSLQVDVYALQNRYSALAGLFYSASEMFNNLEPGNVEEVLKAWRKGRLHGQVLLYELNTLLHSLPDQRHAWKVSDVSLRRLAKSKGLLRFDDPYACLEVLFNALSKDSNSSLITVSGMALRMKLAREAVNAVFFGAENRKVLYTDLRIASGEREK